jgi:hypothetical protein
MPSFAYQLLDRTGRLFGYDLPELEDSPEAEQTALSAARQWVSPIDGGAYGEAWTRAAPPLQEAIPKAEWVTKIREARASLGPVQSRDVARANYVSSLPGVVERECVILQFDTRFENRAGATEKMTLAKTEDGTWHSVDGYHFK